MARGNNHFIQTMTNMLLCSLMLLRVGIMNGKFLVALFLLTSGRTLAANECSSQSNGQRTLTFDGTPYNRDSSELPPKLFAKLEEYKKKLAKKSKSNNPDRFSQALYDLVNAYREIIPVTTDQQEKNFLLYETANTCLTYTTDSSSAFRFERMCIQAAEAYILNLMVVEKNYKAADKSLQQVLSMFPEDYNLSPESLWRMQYLQGNIALHFNKNGDAELFLKEAVKNLKNVFEEGTDDQKNTVTQYYGHRVDDLFRDLATSQRYQNKNKSAGLTEQQKRIFLNSYFEPGKATPAPSRAKEDNIERMPKVK